MACREAQGDAVVPSDEVDKYFELAREPGVVTGISQGRKPTPSGETVSTSRNTHYALAGSRSTGAGVGERDGEQRSKLPRKSRVCAQDVRTI
jgi:hypothetical protein